MPTPFDASPQSWYPGKMEASNLEKPVPETFFRRGDHGFVEIVDMLTGKVVAVQQDIEFPPGALYVEQEINGKTVFVQTGLDMSRITGIRDVKYSKALTDIICQKIIEGTQISQLHKLKGMPDQFTFSLWRRKFPDFEEAIRFARKMRAERLRDEACTEADLAAGKIGELVSGHKLKVDTLKWAAEKDSPEEYGSKVAVSGSIGLTHLVVETGIRRPGDPGFKEKQVQEAIDVVANPAE